MSDLKDGAYREGIQALLDEHETRLRRVTERASTLDGKARAGLLRAQVRELDAAEARLAQSPSTREELETAEGVLDAYERQVDVAVAVIAELRDQRARDAEGRRGHRRHAVLTAACLAVTVAGLAGWGLYADHQATARREERRRNAHFAGCRQRPECKQRGLCSAPPREKWGSMVNCIAAMDDDCMDSADCHQHGQCSAVDGACRVVTVTNCRGSEDCHERGECSPVDGTCRVVSDADCRDWELCWQHGRCSADHGVCRVLTPADCARSKGCKEQGKCAPRDGKCVISDEGCRATEGCKHLGACSAVGSVCGPRTPEECAASVACKVTGKCALGDGPTRVCITSAAGCRASSWCREGGQCTPSDGQCVVGSNADCLSSANCKKWGNCTRRDAGFMFMCGPREGPLEGR